MSVFAVPCTVFMGSITKTDGTGGTALGFFDRGEIEVRGYQKAVGRVLNNPAGHTLAVTGDVVGYEVVMRLRGQDTDSLAKILELVRTGTGAKADQHTALKGVTSYGLIIIPVDSAEPIFYTPAARFRSKTREVFRLLWSPDPTRSMFTDTEITWDCGVLPASQTEPPCVWESAANIASSYAAISVP